MEMIVAQSIPAINCKISYIYIHYCLFLQILIFGSGNFIWHWSKEEENGSLLGGKELGRGQGLTLNI